MRLELHQDLEAFRERALPLLLSHEEMNCILLAQLRRAPQFELLATIDNGRDVLMAATLVRPHTVLLTPEHESAASFLAEQVRGQGMAMPGVQAATGVAEAFAQAWCRAGEAITREARAMAIYAIEAVNAVVSPGGEFRPATIDDLPTLIGFVEQFGRDINEPVVDPSSHATALIQQERLFVWTDESGRIASMAAWAGPTPNGVRVNHVFTPADLRGRGYATACVAKLTSALLGSGRRFVCLFADLANPTSNGIYRRIGYRPVGELKQLWFDRQ